MILLTTSLRPGKGARLLARGLSNSIFGFYMNRGSRPFDAVIRKAASLGCQRAAFVVSREGKPSEIRFASIDGGWGWAREVFNVKRHSQGKAVRGSGEVSSKSKRLGGTFGLCGSPYGAKRTMSYSGKRLSVKEGKKEVFWVEGSFSKR